MDSGASSYRHFREGDTAAFERIVKEYFDPLVFFLYRYVGDYAASEDIAMDAFAYVWAFPRHYNGKVSFKTYLFMLGRSRALDYIKHRSKLTMLPLEDVGEQAATQPSLEELLLTDLRKKVVHRALTQLPEDMRLTVHLTFFEEMSAEQIAKVLKKNKKQIYNLLYRAKKQLRTILGKEGEELL